MQLFHPCHVNYLTIISFIYFCFYILLFSIIYRFTFVSISSTGAPSTYLLCYRRVCIFNFVYTFSPNLASISFHNLVDQSEICYLFYIVKIIFFTLFYLLNIEISILTIWTVTDFQFEGRSPKPAL